MELELAKDVYRDILSVLTNQLDLTKENIPLALRPHELLTQSSLGLKE